MSVYRKSIIVWLLIILLIVISSLIDMRGFVIIKWANHDKHIHLVVFAMFMLITKFLFKQFSIFKITLITFLLGVVIELMQELVTNGVRHFHFNDIFFNMLGIGLGVIFLVIVKNNKKDKNSPNHT